VSQVTQKGFDIESLNLMGRLLSIFRFAPGVSLVDLSSICRLISVDLVKRLTEQWRVGAPVSYGHMSSL
jgi:hypothetical protein